MSPGPAPAAPRGPLPNPLRRPGEKRDFLKSIGQSLSVSDIIYAQDAASEKFHSADRCCGSGGLLLLRRHSRADRSGIGPSCTALPHLGRPLSSRLTLLHESPRGPMTPEPHGQPVPSRSPRPVPEAATAMGFSLLSPPTALALRLSTGCAPGHLTEACGFFQKKSGPSRPRTLLALNLCSRQRTSTAGARLGPAQAQISAHQLLSQPSRTPVKSGRPQSMLSSTLSALSQDLWRRLDFGLSLSLTFFPPCAARLTSRQQASGLIYDS